MKDNVIVKLDNVSKKFNDSYVIKDVSLDIYEGEFITLLGPSGCGKTTILRMISGLERVSSGKVFIDNKDVTDTDPTKREVNTIFQNFALFSKMTVYENVAFGLRMQKRPDDEIKSRVSKVIKLVKLEGYEDRYPAELSGGQQQRVAIARGIIMNPKVLLLDESLCSLDLKLKKSMQIELKRIQKKLGITFIYVTHAQDEALSMSDRVAIINKGVIEQLGTPSEIYMDPKTVFVANFIGEANIVEGEIKKQKDDIIDVSILDGTVISIKTNDTFKKGEIVKVIIRPEDVKIYYKNKEIIINAFLDTGNKLKDPYSFKPIISVNKLTDSITGVITDYIYGGENTKLILDLYDGKYSLKTSVTDEEKYETGDTVYIKFEEKYIVALRK